MTKTTVHLLRHGEVFNPEKVLYGRLPGYELSELGHEMARGVAEYLNEHEADLAAVIASPLIRAQQTAAPTAQLFELEIGTEDRIIEAANQFEGLTFGVGDGSLKRPAHWNKLYNPFRPSWGEPYTQQVARMHAAVADARDAYPGREVLLVSHQLPIWMARLGFEGKRLWHDPRKRQCNLASLTSIVFEDETLVGINYQEPVSYLYANASKVAGA